MGSVTQALAGPAGGWPLTRGLVSKRLGTRLQIQYITLTVTGISDRTTTKDLVVLFPCRHGSRFTSHRILLSEKC